MWSGAAVSALFLNGYFTLVFFRETLAKDSSPNGVGPSFAEPIPNTTIAAGRDVILPCVVNDLGDYKLAWVHKDRHTLLTLQERIITRNTRYSLTHNGFRTWWLSIKDVEESDKGEYMCQINTSPMISQSGYLEVVVSPKIVEESTSSDTDIREGSDVNLRCRASGFPTPKITWRREDQKDIQAGMKSNSLISGEYMNITKASRLNMGAYLCIASNGVQPSVSKRIMLNVKFAPMIWIPNQLIGAPLDTDILLDCGLESFPKSVTYWKKDDIIILSNSKYDSMLLDSGSYKSKMHLRIRNLKQEDFGFYTCVAKNALGETEGTIKLYEIPRPTTAFSPQFTSKTSKTDGSPHTTSEKMPLNTWQYSSIKDNTESARKAELSTELLDKGSTSGGIAAAAASDYEYRGQGAERKDSRRHLNDGAQNSGINTLSSLFSSVIAFVGLDLLLQVL
uniref:Putative lachesin n=1 Tax=Cupiennius salei TaxID=6928 RepID=T1DFY0_CUPSA